METCDLSRHMNWNQGSEVIVLEGYVSLVKVAKQNISTNSHFIRLGFCGQQTTFDYRFQKPVVCISNTHYTKTPKRDKKGSIMCEKLPSLNLSQNIILREQFSIDNFGCD